MICNSNNYPSKAIMIMHALHSSHRFFTTNLALFKKKKTTNLANISKYQLATNKQPKNRGAKWL